MTPRRPLALLALLAAACAAAPQARRPLPPPPGESRTGTADRGAGPAHAPRAEGTLPRKEPKAEPPGRDAQVAVATASALVGRRGISVDGVDYGTGCAALVRASLAKAGHPLPADVKDASRLYAYAADRGALRSGRRAQAGDVVFLGDRPGGPASHAGLVARTDPDGTALVLHRVARGVARLRVNLAWPQKTNDPATGRLVNDTLTVGQQKVPAGSLVVGVADLLK